MKIPLPPVGGELMRRDGARSGAPSAPRWDRGAGMTEYGAVILLVAALVVAVFATGIPDRVSGFFDTGVCEVEEAAQGSEECEDTASDPADDENNAAEPKPARAPDEPTPDTPPSPDDEDFDAAEEAADDIREYWDESDDFWGCLFGCPDAPAEILNDLTDAELDALFQSLTADEIRRLLGEEGVREIALSRLPLQTIRDLRLVDEDGIEPDFDDVGGDDANENGQEDDLRWGRVDEDKVRLWPEDGEIGMDDIQQGALGDCWWLAGLGAIADKHPELIKDMITENANGTYTVTFPDNGEQVTVTADMVMNGGGGPAFARPSGGAMWPIILEKAYAQREGSFGEIEGGRATNAMELVTGDDSKTYDTDDVDQSDLEGWLNGNKTAVTVSTFPEGDGDDGPLYDKEPSKGGLANSHAYIVQDIDEDGNVTLYNPWGYSHVTLTQEEFQRHVRRVDINSHG
ncbi:C2 family cysteine protease [Nocardiopsis sp. RSe5-2]|uniref:C2 family cysteine protease n=1 Tax=Nocardiopsis endophytica TaxID=3018445 RepID=A0ABT4U2K6_9ACTN|nr:C2 family cysteine protease [Nocardiopsis endophytica]MDA2811155.1 C2 family cysteine protease [Nocardiopsis endophytica]